jgi:hypothetical protein
MDKNCIDRFFFYSEIQKKFRLNNSPVKKLLHFKFSPNLHVISYIRVDEKHVKNSTMRLKMFTL